MALTDVQKRAAATAAAIGAFATAAVTVHIYQKRKQHRPLTFLLL